MKLHFRPRGFRFAIRRFLTTLLAFYGGCYLSIPFHGHASYIGGIWATVSTIIVLQASSQDTWKNAGLRILGTFIGAVISAVYLFCFPFHPIGMSATIGLTVLVCVAFNVPDYARLACITVAIMMMAAVDHPGLNPALNATLRFLECSIGALIAVGMITLWPEKDPPQK